MKTTTDCHPDEFCMSCTETGGVVPQAPRQFYCMAEKCNHPDRMCMFVQNGGNRP